MAFDVAPTKIKSLGRIRSRPNFSDQEPTPPILLRLLRLIHGDPAALVLGRFFSLGLLDRLESYQPSRPPF